MRVATAETEILGHTQISTTMDLYSHAMPAARRETADLMWTASLRPKAELVQGMGTSWWPWTHPHLLADPRRSSVYRRGGAVFTRTATPLRPLTVVVDPTLRGRAADDEKGQYLHELLTVGPVDAHLYAVEGPPKHVARLVDDATGVEAVEEWVRVLPRAADQCPEVAYVRSGTPTRAKLQTDDPSYRFLVDALPRGPEPSPGRAERARADALALLVARTIRADLFVTDRVLLAEPESSFWWTTTVVRPDDALPIVGLYLRQQGKFVLGRTPALGATTTRPNAIERDRISFYWMAAKDLVPAAGGWSAAFGARAEIPGNEELALLPTALTQRVYQALRARDRLLSSLSVSQDNDTADDALTELDQILLWLTGAFDVAAQVAHAALGVKGKRRFATWQNPDWLKEVRTGDKPLADRVSQGGPGGHLLTILNELRNSIPGEPLSAPGLIPNVGDRAMESLGGLPRRERAQILAAMDALGGRAAWGVAEPLPGYHLHLHPGEFVERLLPPALALLDDLIAATPMERLAGTGANLGELPRTRPRGPLELRTRMQLGL